MNERERILDLVKKGIISSEEALVLLENLAKDHHEETPSVTAETSHADGNDEPTDHDTVDQAMTELNTKIADVTGALDAANAQLDAINKKIAANKEQIIVLDTMEDLESLSTEKYNERGELKTENQQLDQQVAPLSTQIDNLKQELSELTRQKRQLQKQAFSDKIFSDEWKNDARDAFGEFGRTVGSATTQIGGFVKDTVSSVLDNVDWKNVTITVPGLATEKFTHTFTYPDATATIIDLKLANGDVIVKPWDQNDIKVEATIKLYGKMAEATPREAFTARSRISIDADRFVFQVPNKRIQADLVIFVPEREYDHVSLRVLNGNATIQTLAGKDFYVKSTNGDIHFQDAQAVMIEAEGVNGTIDAHGTGTQNLILTTVNGDVTIDTDANTAALQTVNGTVRARYTTDFGKLEATSMNGNVKVALPTSIALTGNAKTRFGSVKNRLSGLSATEKGTKRLELDRPGTGDSTLVLTTTSGNIQLKDAL